MIATKLTRQALVSAKLLRSNALLTRSLHSIAPSIPRTDENDRRDLRQLHSTAVAQNQTESAITAVVSVPETINKPASSALFDRFIVTAEVTVSKIFPAGFGWQTASLLAANAGQSPDSLNFALSTGVGDGVGVLLGHCAFYGAKKALVNNSINMTQEFNTGIFLGTAAFCSGTAWQPIVNALQGANLTFSQVFFGTWMGCGLAFYGGLRMGRTLLAGPLKYIEEPTYDNSKTDAALSVSIGGATGFFVGTDAVYLPEQNFLIHLLGIQEGTADFVGCGMAGSSTSLGFLTAQTTLNLIYPRGTCWND